MKPPQTYEILSQTKARAQLGGTLLGLVIGVLIGLAAALAVAVYVTNVPVPFVDRGVTRKAGARRGRGRAQQGLEPQCRTGGHAEPLPAPVTERRGSGAEAATWRGAGTLPSHSGCRVSNGTHWVTWCAPNWDDDSTRTRARTGRRTCRPRCLRPHRPCQRRAAQQCRRPFCSLCRSGHFSSADDANAQRAKVALMGMASQVTEREQSGRTVYRVRLGPFQSEGPGRSHARPVAKSTVWMRRWCA